MLTFLLTMSCLGLPVIIYSNQYYCIYLNANLMFSYLVTL